MKQGERFCYHCKKKYRVYKTRGRLILISVVCIILVCINLLIFFASDNINMPVLILMNISVVTAAVLILPLTVRFKAEKIKKSEKKKIEMLNRKISR